MYVIQCRMYLSSSLLLSHNAQHKIQYSEENYKIHSLLPSHITCRRFVSTTASSFSSLSSFFSRCCTFPFLLLLIAVFAVCLFEYKQHMKNLKNRTHKYNAYVHIVLAKKIKIHENN